MWVRPRILIEKKYRTQTIIFTAKITKLLAIPMRATKLKIHLLTKQPQSERYNSYFGCQNQNTKTPKILIFL